MNLKLIALLSLPVCGLLASGCSRTETRPASEVVIEKKSGGTNDEVKITAADLKTEEKGFSPVKTGGQLPNRSLSDRSRIETIIDGFGNKIETRHFPDHPRVRMVILRTSSTGQMTATVYGRKGDTKIVTSLGENAMTASADELANLAQISTETKFTTTQDNFMKGRQNQSTTPLQPLPSSSFQQPAQPVQTQPVQPVQPQSPGMDNGETPSTQQTNPDDEDLF